MTSPPRARPTEVAETLCTRCRKPCAVADAVALRLPEHDVHVGFYHPVCAKAELKTGWYPCAGLFRPYFQFNRMPYEPTDTHQHDKQPCTSAIAQAEAT